MSSFVAAWLHVGWFMLSPLAPAIIWHKNHHDSLRGKKIEPRSKQKEKRRDIMSPTVLFWMVSLLLCVRILIHKGFHCWEHFSEITLVWHWQRKGTKAAASLSWWFKRPWENIRTSVAGAIFFQGIHISKKNCHDTRFFWFFNQATASVISRSTGHMTASVQKTWWAFNISKCPEQKDEVYHRIMLHSPRAGSQ